MKVLLNSALAGLALSPLIYFSWGFWALVLWAGIGGLDAGGYVILVLSPALAIIDFFWIVQRLQKSNASSLAVFAGLGSGFGTLFV